MAGTATTLLTAALTPTAAAQARTDQPPGRPVDGSVDRPADAQRLACSFHEPVCVHASPSTAGAVSPATVADTLSVAEGVLGGLRALGLPPPLGDGALGGSADLDIYLAATGSGTAAHADSRVSTASLDRTSAFVIAPARVAGPECGTAAGLARGLSQAVLLGLDAAQHEGTLALHSSYLASLLTPCHALEAAAVDQFQRTPQRSLTSGRRDRHGGAMLLSAYLDSAYGMGTPGAVMSGLIATSGQQSPPEATHWSNEPDVFDALREVLPSRGKQLGEMLVDFAVARAFVGNRSDGAHLSDTERFGDLGRVRFEWSIPYDTLPRRVGPLRPVEPSGATYLWLDLTKAKPHSGVLFIAEWEESFVFQWCLVRVDAEGREIGRSNLGGVFGKNLVQLTLNDLGEAAGLLMVGTSLGNDDRSNAFDPDVGPPREAAYEVTLHAR
ncbi:MAG: hypothetical protein JRI68_02245 [Deltaproteobacteria bacterium]|nr:hypothetical protein [Deltaproteobacteria bacterium]